LDDDLSRVSDPRIDIRYMLDELTDTAGDIGTSPLYVFTGCSSRSMAKLTVAFSPTPLALLQMMSLAR
jgi:K+ transporter